jgi:hypothetical protein
MVILPLRAVYPHLRRLLPLQQHMRSGWGVVKHGVVLVLYCEWSGLHIAWATGPYR